VLCTKTAGLLFICGTVVSFWNKNLGWGLIKLGLLFSADLLWWKLCVPNSFWHGEGQANGPRLWGKGKLEVHEKLLKNRFSVLMWSGWRLLSLNQHCVFVTFAVAPVSLGRKKKHLCPFMSNSAKWPAHTWGHPGVFASFSHVIFLQFSVAFETLVASRAFRHLFFKFFYLTIQSSNFSEFGNL